MWMRWEPCRTGFGGRLLLPAGAPPPVLAALHGAVRRAMADATVRERITGMGAVAEGSDPAQFAAYLAARRPAIVQLIRSEGITLE